MNNFLSEYSVLYDSLYEDKDYKKECAVLEEIFKTKEKTITNILDFGCGTGGHIRVFSDAGYSLTGVDLSRDMLKVANEKLSNAKNVTLVNDDIATFSDSKKYDAIISMFAVIGYQTKNKQLSLTLKNARKHLIKDGLFIFDVWNGNAVLLDKPQTKIKEMRKNRKIVYRLTTSQIDYNAQIVTVNFKILTFDNLNGLTESYEKHEMRYFFPKEIEYYLTEAGFKNVQMFPFVQIDKKLTEKDWNMLVVAEAN